ncbi:PAS domain S-box protein [Solirubrobacter ginsenosidimutans]|uniref:histidine kinase n=1 Tax=Solirubrobacter ginsenosidimutans TaxID=490573 RepID=A0A9X3MQ79_9ACTN|nr:PAS domain S-box protein [Solirubrobacter ginsenosidimutans]MDA0159862.1 PAS domain S-box protein [Solirubrobacter ginsenosidimutans]
MQPRHIARVALFLALTVVGSIIARVLAERDVRRDSDRRAEVAAVQIHGRIAQAAALTESLRRFMLDARSTGVTSDQFARNALRWLGSARLPAAAWVERVPDTERAAYERRIGQSIVTADVRYGVVPVGSRSSYLPATLVTGFPPMALPGIDLSGASGLAAALSRATRLNGVVATPMASSRTGTSGLFLVAPAPNLAGKVLRPGYAVTFVSASGLRAAATGVPAVQVTTAGQVEEHGDTSAKSFTAAGQRFTVVVPREAVQGAAAVLPWVILAGGLLVVALGGALALNAARRARAQEELDRIFTMSQDLIAVADFDGRFTRVNPAAEEILGYTEEELLARPYIDLVHPADRDSTATEADTIAQGKPTASFENRYVRKDGSVRVLNWTTTPDVEQRLMYTVARDVTERREAEAEVKRLADEQAALRRVATLVAREASHAELFTAIAAECAQLFGTEDIGMVRYEGGRHQVVMASSGTFKVAFPAGSRQPLGGDNAASLVFRTGRSARIDDYAKATGPIADAIRPAGLRCAVAAPIMVEGRLWGAMITGTSGEEPLPLETESRIGQFTELMATAIANAEARAEVTRLVDEQAALRRVATLVAQGVAPNAVFDAVTGEVAGLLGASAVSLARDDGDRLTVVAQHGVAQSTPMSTGRTTRPVDLAEANGDIARRAGMESVVAAPIVVDGRTWGALVALWAVREAARDDTEERLARFAELLATAIANADNRDQLTASRARVLTAGDDARRRVVRDLHDGAQQRLIETVLTLKLAQQALRETPREAETYVADALSSAERATAELRELAHGILPTVLTRGGLDAGVRAFVSRLDLPVDIHVSSERLPREIEASAYFIVAEALTNVVKHARASHADVTVSVEGGMLHVAVRDDGIGGADPGGHGLVGIADRVTALGGRLELERPAGGGTLLTAELPLSTG